MVNPCNLIIHNTEESLADYGRRRPVDPETGNPIPFRLVMICISDNCQFCSNPKGDIFQYFISLEHRLGFVSCEKCKPVASEYREIWLKTKAYGPASKFLGQKINVRRSSGVIESDWELNKEYPMIEYIDNEECVECINSNSQIKKMVRIDDLLNLNS